MSDTDSTEGPHTPENAHGNASPEHAFADHDQDEHEHTHAGQPPHSHSHQAPEGS